MIDLLIRAIIAGTPLMIAALGETFTEKSGILNLGLEGIFVLGGASAFITTLYTGNPFLGLIVAGLSGALLGLIHGIVSVSFRGRQVVSGLALTFLGYGIASTIGKAEVGRPLPTKIYLTTYASYLIIAEIMIILILWIILYKLKIGAIIRACGENPYSAYSLGVNVIKVRLLSTIFGSFLGGLAGGWYVLAYIHVWTEGMGMGRGWIALAIVIVSAWNPIFTPFTSFLFGGLEVIIWRLQLPPYNFDTYLLGSIPYLVTILILTLFMATPVRKYFRPPAALGEPFYREQRTV
jgi:simple sugar transport system permease protein